MPRNLLKNPYGDDGMDFWELTENGGDGWRVEDMPGGCGYEFYDQSVKKYFCTSNTMCLKRQVIDLVAEGYSPDDLDNKPIVSVYDWHGGRTDCGCMYKLSVCLLDENKEVLQKYKPDIVYLDPDSGDCKWRQVTKTFCDFGPGLRYIAFEHGGKDTKFWAGWYGVRVTGSFVTLDVGQVGS